MPVFSHKAILAVAAVVDMALQKDGRPIAAKRLAARHGLPARYLDLVLQRLVRAGILHAFRGPRGGYGLVREGNEITAHDVLRAATKLATGEEPNSELVTSVVLPALSAAEQEFGQVLGRISMDDMVKFAGLNGYGEIQDVGRDQITLTVQRTSDV